MKDLEHSARVLGQVLRVRAWEMEQQRALLRDAAQTFSACLQQQRGIEGEIVALGEYTRERLATGRKLDANLLHLTRHHGEACQRNLDSAVEQTTRAEQHHDTTRDALSTVFSQHRALERRHGDLMTELGQLALKQSYREQDERHAASPSAHRRLHEQD